MQRFFLLSVLTITAFACSLSPKMQNKFGGHTYVVVNTPDGITYEEAKDRASAMGGYLTVINSAEENNVVYRLAADDSLWFIDSGGGSLGPWIGGYQKICSPEPGCGWSWINGEPWTYTNWAKGQPNNCCYGEDRINLFGSNSLKGPHWNDLHHNVKLKGFLVEFDGAPYVYQVPQETKDGWETSSLTEESVDSKIIFELIEKILSNDYKNVHSVLLVKNGKLILEEYFLEFHRERPHQIRSATKSINSILTGIAIDQGLIKDVTEKTYPYLKSYEPTEGWDMRVRDVTIKSILTMTSGYDCDDFGTRYACELNMKNSDDWLKCAMNLSMVHEPGSYWAYNSVTPQLIEEIISERSGMSLQNFSNKYLFEPLGITDFHWFLTPKGRTYVSGEARMRPRDMAKIGYLALNKGKWKNTQIVSERWIYESTKEHTSPPVHSLLAKSSLGTCGYAYLWWTKDFSINKENIQSFFATGSGGQMIFVFPRLHLVAVFTQGNYGSSLCYQPFEMLTDYIIPAIL